MDEAISIPPSGVPTPEGIDRDPPPPTTRDCTLMSRKIFGMSLFLSDSTTVIMIATAKKEGRLAKPSSRGFQYSLGTLILYTICLGGYISRLVVLFRS